MCDAKRADHPERERSCRWSVLLYRSPCAAQAGSPILAQIQLKSTRGACCADSTPSRGQRR